MALPIRCFTCNKVIGQYETEYVSIMNDENQIHDFFKKHGITRFCCKRMFMTTCYDIHDKFIECNEDNLPSQVNIGEHKKIVYLKAI